MTPIFSARVNERGQVIILDRPAFDDYCKSLTGKLVDLTIKRHRETRSSQANRYYFGVVIKLISEHTGYEPDEMHEVLAMRFLRIEDCPITGAPRRKRTPQTNTAEFSEYVDQCIRFAAIELGVTIPQPEQVDVG